ncbi:MAG: hypothetical protein MZU97_00630 [Bacillus subtilis]|nr:hypothetical protein [Bacillus subtilis]
MLDAGADVEIKTVFGFGYKVTTDAEDRRSCGFGISSFIYFGLLLMVAFAISVMLSATGSFAIRDEPSALQQRLRTQPFDRAVRSNSPLVPGTAREGANWSTNSPASKSSCQTTKSPFTVRSTSRTA